jgi:sugar phosphate isomerase/epimerase
MDGPKGSWGRTVGGTIGYQAVYDESYLDALRFAAHSGFDYVQFDLNVPHFSLHGMSASDRRLIRDAAGDLGVGLSFHAPGDNVSLFTDHHGIRQAILRHFADIIAAAEDLGARHVTLHPGLHPSFRAAGGAVDAFMLRYADYYAQVLADNLTQLAQGARGVLLCVENYGMDALAMDALERLFRDDTPVFLTWDVAKAAGHPEVVAFYRARREKIRELHLHDAIAGGQSHLALGQGEIDFDEALPLVLLDTVATTIEVRPREQAAASRQTLLAMLGRPGAPPG